ncbi:hypothetical protein [Lysinibacillus fusiformis]|uniref:Uncharacterized protein n=1 Tax=Lysinibacillus fusiformis TaxID=28031 RepID=A0A1E4QYI1_9BACI|nr:hypothetical protein [Lysinibacillus fusiformis]ODV53256.1 hypothetical protein BG258_23420 [Lysinibacillus fusiformis]
MSKVEFSVKIYGNTIEIIPSEPVKDNSIYDITFTDVKARLKEKRLEKVCTEVYTKMSPSYCSLESVNSLIDSIDLEDERILYYIKEASRYTEYISGKNFDEANVPFNVHQFVKFRATHDAILKLFIEKASEAGRSGKMGELEFKMSDCIDSLKDLLDYLKGESDKWESKVLSGITT